MVARSHFPIVKRFAQLLTGPLQTMLFIEGSQVASIALLDKQQCEVLRVICPQAEAFGIWAPYKPGCPFVCLEPWCGIADRYNFNGDISEREYNHSLSPGESYVFSYTIQIA